MSETASKVEVVQASCLLVFLLSKLEGRKAGAHGPYVGRLASLSRS